MRISKASWNNQLQQYIVLPKMENYWHCPFSALLRHWKFKDRPKTGFIFNDLRQNSEYIDGKKTLRLVQNMAIKRLWESVPTGHTMRISLLAYLVDLGFDREKICMHFGWKHDSEMVRHYQHGTLIHSENGIAETIREHANSGFPNFKNLLS